MLARLVSIAAAALAIGPRVAAGETCLRATEGPTVVLASAPWRQAVADLREATGDRAQPWGCAGGTIDIVEHDGHATLIIATADGSVNRDADTPDDVVPLGEALLAKPIAAPTTKPAAPPASGGHKTGDPAETPPPGEHADPRVVVSALVAPRFAGRANMMLGGVSAEVGIPVKKWVPALWVRFDGPLTSFYGDDASLMEFCAGGAFGRNFDVGIVELRPSVTGSAAILVRPSREHIRGYTQADPRFGAAFQVALPRDSIVRAVIATDLEIAPLDFDEDGEALHERTSQVASPSYTLGLGLGVEIAPK